MGADSLALTAAVDELRARGRLGDVLVIHVDHGQHEHSALAAARAIELAAGLGLNVAVERPALGPGASEAVLRDARYAAFATAMRRHGARTLLLAHHADDQVETLVMRAQRGTSARGLAGIPERREFATGLTLLRPLLALRKQDLATALAASGLAAFLVEDPTNASLDFLRNRVRMVVLPALRAARGAGFDDELLLRADRVRRRTDAIGTAARAWLASQARLAPRRRAELDEPLPAATRVAREVLRLAFETVAGEAPPRAWLHRAQVLAAGPRGALLDAHRSLLAERTHRGLLLVSTMARITPAAPVALSDDGAPCSFGASGVAIEARRHALDAAPVFDATRRVAWIDAARVALPLSLRAPRVGDRFEQHGQIVALDLRRHLEGRHVPRLDRDRLPLVVDRDDRIVWAPGLDVAAFARLATGAREAVELRVTLGAMPAGSPCAASSYWRAPHPHP